MQGEPCQSGYMVRYFGKEEHENFCVLWPKREEAEARIDFFDHEKSFQQLRNGQNKGLQDAYYMYVDEFSGIGIKPTGNGEHILQLIRRGATEKQSNVDLKLRATQNWVPWVEGIYSIICAYKKEGRRPDNACLDSMVKLGKRAEKYSVVVCDTTLTSSLGLAGVSAILYILTSGIVLKPNKTDRTIAWSFGTIRRYKNTEEMLTMEIGRRAETGPGIVQFANKKTNEIIYKISRATELFQARVGDRKKCNVEENIYVEVGERPSSLVPDPPSVSPEYESLGYIMSGETSGNDGNPYATLDNCQ